jgi:signal peptidase II
MAEADGESGLSGNRFWGPLTVLGLAFAALSFGLDQTVKWWLLNVFELDARGDVPFFSPLLALRLTLNHGVSYGFLTTHVQPLLVTVSLLLTALLWLWLARAQRPLAAAGLGLIIGGALSNALDRALHGAVLDFLYFPFLQGLNFAPLQFIFNPADAAIVAGVLLLLYDSALDGRETPSH